MRNIVLLGLMFCFISCKTIEIKEKNAFRNSKYDYDLYEKYINRSNIREEEKEELQRILHDLVKTDKKEIVTKENIAIERDFFQANDSIRMEYFKFTPKNHSKTGLFFLGNGSTILRVFNELEELAVASQTKIYVLNYRGYGKSDGDPSFRTAFADNQNFLNFLKERQNQLDFVIGYSLGTVSATYLTVDNKIDKLILLAPISNATETVAAIKKRQTRGLAAVLRPFIKLKIPDYLSKLSNNEKIKNYQGTLIVMHALDDETLPYSMGLGVFNSCQTLKKELITIENGGHKAPFDQANWNRIIDCLK